MTKDNSDYYIHESSEIDNNVSIGSKTKIWHYSHILSNTRIGRSVTVGQGCMIGPNVIVGDHTKLQNNVSLFDGLIVEENVFFGPSCVMTNVKNPRSSVNRKDKFEKTIIREEQLLAQIQQYYVVSKLVEMHLLLPGLLLQSLFLKMLYLLEYPQNRLVGFLISVRFWIKTFIARQKSNSTS